MWWREGLFRTYLVEVCEFDAYLPLLVLFMDYDDVGKPTGVMDLAD